MGGEKAAAGCRGGGVVDGVGVEEYGWGCGSGFGEGGWERLKTSR